MADPVITNLKSEGYSRTALGIAGQLADPSVMGAVSQLPAAQPRAQPLAAPPMRRTRSASGGGLKDLLKQTHGAESFHGADGVGGNGLSLFPPTEASNSMFTVDVGLAGPPPALGRSNTSFFKSLAGEEVFSPSVRDLLAGFAGDETGFGDLAAAGPSVIDHMAIDSNAPPGLRRVASGQSLEVPKLTRSVSAYMNQLDAGLEMQNSGGSTGARAAPPLFGPPAILGLARENTFDAGELAASLGMGPSGVGSSSVGIAAGQPPPPLDKRRSSRLSFGALASLAGMDD